MKFLTCLLISSQILSTVYTKSLKNASDPAQLPVYAKDDVDTVKVAAIKKAAKKLNPADELIWADEFNGNKINTANWTFETGNGHDGWGNKEKEYYQSDNAKVANGNLIITAKKQHKDGFAYTSSRMITKGKREFTYGHVEARMKLSQGKGQWPAFWMLGANIDEVSWPKCGEIDIMENTNTSDTVLGTVHWFNNSYTYSSGKTTTTPSAYHVYSIDWTPESITWFVDGVKFHTVNIKGDINGTDEFHKPFYILFNLAVGGNLPGQEIDEDKLPAVMYVDYVRVYQLKK